MRRLIGVLLLALAAGTLVPAASATAGANPVKSGPQRFGVRLVNVPVSEAHNPRGLRYIIDYLPAGAVVHRRIAILNEESTKSHFTVYPDAAQITHGKFIGDAGTYPQRADHLDQHRAPVRHPPPARVRHGHGDDQGAA